MSRKGEEMIVHRNTDLFIFFDESGKEKRDKVQLMGGLVIPANIYNNKKLKPFRELNQEYQYHWSQYKEDSKQKSGLIKLLKEARLLAEYCRINFIRYSTTKLTEKGRMFDYNSNQSSGHALDKSEIVRKMIYTKLPERIVYGLLRGYGQTRKVNAKIHIEHATEYETFELAEDIQLQLNMHSLYRGESFVIEDCVYCKKGDEIGVELTDILLGIVRTILENPNPESNKKKAQITLILELLKAKLLQPLIKRLRLFELKEYNELYEVSIESSVELFISNHFDEYVSM